MRHMGQTDFFVNSTLIEIPNGNYEEDVLLSTINNELGSAGFSDITLSHSLNTKKTTLTNSGGSNYTIEFYNNSNPGNKKNSNLGWLLGWRNLDNSYNNIIDLSGGSYIESDSLLDVYGTKYVLLELDDYNNNQLNRNFVSVHDDIQYIHYPCYYSPDFSLSDPTYRSIINDDGSISWVKSGFTQKQAFTISEISKAKQTLSVNINKVNTMNTNNIISKLPIQYSKQFGTLIIGYNL